MGPYDGSRTHAIEAFLDQQDGMVDGRSLTVYSHRKMAVDGNVW